MSFGIKVREFRKRKGWFQKNLSLASGIRLTHISKIENDLTNPKLSTITKIVDALECSYSDLID